MGKKKKNTKKKNKYISDFRIPDYLIWIYLFVMFVGYTLFMHDKYFDITLTKARFFIYASVTFVALMICGYIIEHYVSSEYGADGITLKEEFTKKDRYKSPEFWIIGFFMSNVFAYVVTDYKHSALTGCDAGRMGLIMYTVIALTFLCIYLRAKVNLNVFYFMVLATIPEFVIAFAQHFGKDVFGLRERINPKMVRIYISTFGNINIFASYISICIPVFFVMAIFGKNIIMKIVAYIMIVASGGMLMVANSDSAYIALFVTAVVLYFIALKEKKLVEEVSCGLCISIGNLIVAILQKKIDTKYDKRGGVASALANPKTATALLVLMAFVTIVFYVARKKLKTEKLEVKKVRNISLIVFLSTLALVSIVGFAQGWSFFTFNYEWGTKRGYIWAKCVDLFKNASPVNKLFGYGNDTLKILTIDNYHDEMIKVTGKVYSNAHNELLQYLVTTGLLGLITYLGTFISSVVYMAKYASKNPAIYACLLVVVSYYAQSLINLNQPITTPLYFVIMALGLGIVRYEKKVEGLND